MKNLLQDRRTERGAADWTVSHTLCEGPSQNGSGRGLCSNSGLNGVRSRLVQSYSQRSDVRGGRDEHEALELKASTLPVVLGGSGGGVLVSVQTGTTLPEKLLNKCKSLLVVIQ